MKNPGWIVVVALMVLSCGDDSNTSPSAAAGSSAAGHGGHSSGGVGGHSGQGGAWASAYEGTSGASAEEVNEACPKVRELAKTCGITIPDKPCRPDGTCKDNCTLELSCEELQDLVSGVMSDELTECFERCKQR